MRRLQMGEDYVTEPEDTLDAEGTKDVDDDNDDSYIGDTPTVSEHGSKNIEFTCIPVGNGGKRQNKNTTEESVFKKKLNYDEGKSHGDVAIDSAKMEMIEERFNPCRFLAY